MTYRRDGQITALKLHTGNWLDYDLDRTFGKKAVRRKYRRVHPLNGQTFDYDDKLKMPSVLKIRKSESLTK